ncbi:MAG: phenylacetate--CoA ligase family protein [Lachnospiraceae bacterium]|nr:phenylacetate--CoA ligase family protein [Lachnospiraceae bacterium]
MRDDNRLFQMVCHAYRDVPLYRRLAEEKGFSLGLYEQKKDFSKIPLLERAYAVNHADGTLSDDCIPLMYQRKLLRTHTSGSTGIHMDVWWKKEDYRNSLLPLWMNRVKYVGIKPNDKVCVFNAFCQTSEMFVYEKNSLLISKTDLSDAGLLKIYEKMAEFQPKWLLLQPSMAFLLCEIKKKNKLPEIPSITYIELTGEMCIPMGEKVIEDSFLCTVKKHYGTMEVNTIGYETEKRNIYRIFSSSTMIETLNEKGETVSEGEIGKIYVSSLHNYAMPVIRYETGDRGRLFTKNEKGRSVQYIELMKARQNDLLLLRNGKEIPPDILLNPIEFINQWNENAVLQLQAVQLSLEELELHIVLDEELNRQKFASLYLQQLEGVFSEKFKFSFVFQDSLKPCHGENKVKWFERRIL